MVKLTLWMMDPSPPSWAVMMLGEILGLQFEKKKVNLPTREHKRPEFLKINPMGTIPVLQDGDFIISESHTIMKYLLEKYGGSHRDKLYPRDLKAQALVDQANYFDTGVVFIRITKGVLPAIFGGATHLSTAVVEEIEDCYNILNTYLEKSIYVAGNQMTLADISLGATVTFLDGFHKVNAEKHPRTADWLRCLHDLSYFQTIALPGRKILTELVSSRWEKNNK